MKNQEILNNEIDASLAGLKIPLSKVQTTTAHLVNIRTNMDNSWLNGILNLSYDIGKNIKGFEGELK